jgi:NAD(P)-dependent dehydrogenase (short-subunit alcohol dehydrogenase family)
MALATKDDSYPFSYDPHEFDGKRVLVTGGTKGLGAAMVRRFLIGGAQVALTARSHASSIPDSALFVQADIGTPEGVDIVSKRIQSEWKGLDILIDNVGASDTLSGGFEAFSDEYWERMINVNLMSAIRMDRAFIPGMIERKSGIVIHIGTIWHRLPQSNSYLAYSTAKGALSSYSKGLSKAVAPEGVRVNMVSPGFIETEAAVALIGQVAEGQKISTEAARQQIIALGDGIPLGRTGKPEEIAELVAFLSSERAAFASGVDYFLDGGAFPSV